MTSEYVMVDGQLFRLTRRQFIRALMKAASAGGSLGLENDDPIAPVRDLSNLTQEQAGAMLVEELRRPVD